MRGLRAEPSPRGCRPPPHVTRSSAPRSPVALERRYPRHLVSAERELQRDERAFGGCARQRPYVVALAVGRARTAPTSSLVRHGRRRSGGGRGRADAEGPGAGCSRSAAHGPAAATSRASCTWRLPRRSRRWAARSARAGAEERIALLALEALQAPGTEESRHRARVAWRRGSTATTGGPADAQLQRQPSSLVGRLTRDPELRSTCPRGRACASLRIACNSSRETPTASTSERPNYFDVSVFGPRRRTSSTTCARAAAWRSTGGWSGASGRPPSSRNARR